MPAGLLIAMHPSWIWGSLNGSGECDCEAEVERSEDEFLRFIIVSGLRFKVVHVASVVSRGQLTLVRVRKGVRDMQLWIW